MFSPVNKNGRRSISDVFGPRQRNPQFSRWNPALTGESRTIPPPTEESDGG